MGNCHPMQSQPLNRANDVNQLLNQAKIGLNGFEPTFASRAKVHIQPTTGT